MPTFSLNRRNAFIVPPAKQQTLPQLLQSMRDWIERGQLEERAKKGRSANLAKV